MDVPYTVGVVDLDRHGGSDCHSCRLVVKLSHAPTGDLNGYHVDHGGLEPFSGYEAVLQDLPAHRDICVVLEDPGLVVVHLDLSAHRDICVVLEDPGLVVVHLDLSAHRDICVVLEDPGLVVAREDLGYFGRASRAHLHAFAP